MSDQALRDHVTWLLHGGGAHLDFEAAIADLPEEARGRKAPGLPHTAWQTRAVSTDLPTLWVALPRPMGASRILLLHQVG